MKLKRIISTLLLFTVGSSTFLPTLAYAQEASSSANTNQQSASQSATTDQPASESGQLLPLPPETPAPITRLPNEDDEDSVFSPKSSTMPELAFDEPITASALIKQPIRIRTLEQEHYHIYDIVTAYVDNTKKSDISVRLTDVNNNAVETSIDLSDTADAVMIRITPPETVKPGRYTIEVTDIDEQQAEANFTWGVIALNTDKTLYTKGEKVQLYMAVTDDQGNIACNAKVSVKIIDPNKQTTDLSTDNGTVSTNPACKEHVSTIQADYETAYVAMHSGLYTVDIQATTEDETYTTSDGFVVQENPLPYVVQRSMPTRIYPREPFPVALTVTANEDFIGTIRDIVPGDFVITPSTQSATLEQITNRVSSASAQRKLTTAYPIPQLRLPFDGDFPLSLDFSGTIQDPLLKDLYINFGLIGHDGLDFAMPIGTPLLATDIGTVVWAGPGDYGITVIIEHAWGKSYYGHMSKVDVTEGQIVSRGTPIGLSGNTGISTGPHLHFGIKPVTNDPQNGYYGKIDPLPYLGLSENSLILATTTTGAAQDVKVISWDVALKKGESVELSYILKAPESHPASYLVGPAQFVTYSENDTKETIIQSDTRLWQNIADQSPVLGAQIVKGDQTQVFPMQTIDPKLFETPEGYNLIPAGFDKEITGELASFQVAKDQVKTSFSVKDAAGTEHTASFTLKHASSGETKKTNYSLSRNDIFPNIDAQYLTYDGYLQQILQIESAQARREFAFTLNLSDNLMFDDIDKRAGHVIAKDKTTGDELFTLRFPQGIDAREQRIDYKYRIENNELILYPNRPWQLDQAVFPIRIYTPISVIAWDEVAVTVGDSCEDGKPCERDGDVMAVKPAGWHWDLNTLEENVVVRIDKMSKEQRGELTATTVKPEYVKDERKMQEFKGKDKERVDEYDGLSRFGIDYTQLSNAQELSRVRNKNKGKRSYTPILDARKKKNILKKKRKNIASVINSTRKLAYQKPKEPNIFQRLAKLIVKSASAATTQTASIGSAGGRDYSTPQLWETDNDNNLVSGDLVEKGEMYADSTFTAGASGNYVDFAGATTDATRYMWLTSAIADRHDGTAGNAGVLVDCDGVANAGTTGFNVDTDNTIIEWLKVTDCRGSSGRSGIRIDETTNLLVQYMIIYDFDHANTATAIGISNNAVADTATIRNTFIYDGNAAGGIRGDGTADNLVIENITIWGSGQISEGFREDSSDFDITNSIAMDTTGADFEIVNGTVNYSLSEDTTADDFGGTGNKANQTASIQFKSTTLGSENLHLAVTSTAIDSGNTIAGVTDDIDLDTRTGTYDIGADEFPSPALSKLMRHGKYFGASQTERPFTF